MRTCEKLIGDWIAGPAGDPDSLRLLSCHILAPAGPLDRPVGSPRGATEIDSSPRAFEDGVRRAAGFPVPILSTSSFRSAAQARHHLPSNHRSQAPRPPPCQPCARRGSRLRRQVEVADNTRRRRQAYVSATVRKKAIQQQAAATAPTRRAVAGGVDQCLLHFLLHRHRAVSAPSSSASSSPGARRCYSPQLSGEAGVP